MGWTAPATASACQARGCWVSRAERSRPPCMLPRSVWISRSTGRTERDAPCCASGCGAARWRRSSGRCRRAWSAWGRAARLTIGQAGQDRRGRRRGDLRGSDASHHAPGAGEVGRSAGVADAASGARSAGASALRRESSEEDAVRRLADGHPVYKEQPLTVQRRDGRQ